MNDLIRILLSIGAVCFLMAGLVFIYARFGLEKLPGDIVVQKGNFTFYFPVLSMIVMSVIVNLLIRLWSKN